MKLNFGDHKFEDGGGMKTTLTAPWLLKQDTDFQTKTVIK